MDFGASYRRYKTDVTVPFIKGKVGKRERRIVRTVMDAYKLAVRSWKFGEPCWKIHAKIDGYIRSKRFKMGHAIGHGFGLRIHERPIMWKMKKLRGKRLKKWNKIKKISFKPNMFFTIEPGVYVKNLGGSRIENSFMVSGKKLKRLTDSKLVEVR